ncbi:hypothetical protein C1954_08130 [Bacillus stratosphericus]|nr:hypothetical protein C1954_08130 [Bacillus stratosphericus]
MLVLKQPQVFIVKSQTNYNLTLQNTLIIFILKILRNNLVDKVRPQSKIYSLSKKQITLVTQGFQR